MSNNDDDKRNQIMIRTFLKPYILRRTNQSLELKEV